MYSIMQQIEKEDTVLSITHTMELMNSMYNEMFRKFGDISLDDMRFIVPVRVYECMRRTISYMYLPMVNREDDTLYFAGVKVIIDVDLSHDTIKLVYKEENIMPTVNWSLRTLYHAECSNDLKIKKVIFNKPATIVFWSDDTKTIVKCGEDDAWDEEKGLAMAVCKKMLGLKEFYKQYNKATNDMWEKVNR